MEFSVFVWSVIVFFFLLSGITNILLKKISSIKKTGYRSYYLIGFILLALFMIVYLQYSNQLWSILNKALYPFFNSNKDKYIILLKEIWYTVVFFRNVWPSLMIACLMITLENSVYPISAQYRLMHKFSHNKLMVMVSSLLFYLISEKIIKNQNLATFFLSLAVYTAVYYWKFGFATILYILKRSYIPYELGTILLLGTIVGSGEFFLLPLVTFIGFGLSDIWMDFHHRSAANMVFDFK